MNSAKSKGKWRDWNKSGIYEWICGDLMVHLSIGIHGSQSSQVY